MDLNSVKASLSEKKGAKLINKVWKRIGRANQKHYRVLARYNLMGSEKHGKATNLTWTITKNKIRDDKSKGVYFIRTKL